MAQYWLSWSGYDTYRKCPKKYRLTRVEKLPPPEPESKHNALVGSVVQRVFEAFYNEELWRMGKDTGAHLLERVAQYFHEYLDTEYVDFNHITCKFTALDALQSCQEMVPKVLGGIKRHRLLGPYAKSEVTLKARLHDNYHLFGKLDFVIRQADGTVLLLDGKASKHRDKYVDEGQLYFYALLFYLNHGKYPDKVGIYYYHFADDAEKAFDWYAPDPEKIQALQADLISAFKAIESSAFKAAPKSSHCQWCPWQNVCPEYQQKVASHREKQRWNRAQKGEETLPSLRQSSEGAAFIGFGGKFEASEE